MICLFVYKFNLLVLNPLLSLLPENNQNPYRIRLLQRNLDEVILLENKRLKTGSI